MYFQIRVHRHIHTAPSPAPPTLVTNPSLPHRNTTVGLRNQLVHDYMNLNMTQVLELAAQERAWFGAGVLLGR